MEKAGRQEEVRHKCSWTWPVSNRRSCDRCGVFTKQTNNARCRAKTVNRGCPTCEKEPGSQAGISLRALKVFQRDEKTACHTRIARASRRICLMLLAPSIPSSSGCWPGPRGVTSADGHFLSLSLSRSHSTSGQQENGLTSQSAQRSSWNCRAEHGDFRRDLRFDLQQKHLSPQQASHELANLLVVRLIVFFFFFKPHTNIVFFVSL